MNYILLGSVAGAGAFLFFFTMWIISLRRVVPTNEVHIVQSAKKTTSYGKGYESGVYYEFPATLPLIGITKVVMPVSNFDVDLSSYEAYDKGRLPFVVDVKAFFRIADSNVAAQRVASFDELHSQLTAIVQGSVRTILAKSDIESIMEDRSIFGEQFTSEVREQLTSWGVEPVKNIELMDIRDGKGSDVIHNIMAKKKSFIEMESRTEVAKNMKTAKMAEIDAQKEVNLQSQQAAQEVGLRTNEAERKVQIAQQEKEQALKEQQKITKEKEMEVIKIQTVKSAEINKEVAVVKANQDKETMLIEADANLDFKKKQAEADLEVQRKNAEGIAFTGKAKADAERAMLLAPVEAQTTLAKEIGENQSYQRYLITIEQVKAQKEIGVEQAKALHKADIKVITNSSTPGQGLSNIMDIFSANGGAQLGAMLEGLSNVSEAGASVVKKVTGTETKQ